MVHRQLYQTQPFGRRQRFDVLPVDFLCVPLGCTFSQFAGGKPVGILLQHAYLLAGSSLLNLALVVERTGAVDIPQRLSD